jgi:hypothetical protein
MISMRLRLLAVLATILVSLGCSRHDSNSQPLSPERRTAIANDVRTFALAVAHDVTERGPTAWREEFADDPAFFMAVNGQLAFPNRQVAAQVIQDLPRTIKQINLRWGDDLRIDPLTADLAVVATSYTEVQTDPQGHQVTEKGFFTGVAELRGGRWQFRNAHWSAPVSSDKGR